MMMERSKHTRRFAHSILSRPWKKAIVEDMGFHLAHQMLDMASDLEEPYERLMCFAKRFRKE